MLNLSHPLPTFYAASGHLIMHMFAAFYFVIVLGIEDDWQISYDQLVDLWFFGSLLVGLGSIPAGIEPNPTNSDPKNQRSTN